MPKRFTLEVLTELKDYADNIYNQKLTTTIVIEDKDSIFTENGLIAFNTHKSTFSPGKFASDIRSNLLGKTYATSKNSFYTILDKKKYALAKALYDCLHNHIREECNFYQIKCILVAACKLNVELERDEKNRVINSDPSSMFSNWRQLFALLAGEFTRKIEQIAKKLPENLPFAAITPQLKTGGFIGCYSRLNAIIFVLWQATFNHEKEYILAIQGATKLNADLAKIIEGYRAL